LRRKPASSKNPARKWGRLTIIAMFDTKRAADAIRKP
jgi:hypothetical protein